MTIEADITSALRNNAAIISDAGTNVYAGELPDDAAIGVVFSIIGTVPHNELSGDSALDRLRVQVDVYAADKQVANRLGRSVRAAMTGASFSCYFLNRLDTYEDEVKQHRVSQDFAVWTNPNE